jgi:diguanylate cyclase (GGDEF)-like protein
MLRTGSEQIRAMATHDAFSSLRGPRNGSFFEPYARLIQILYPRVKSVAFYDGDGASVWHKDPEIERSLAGAVRGLIQDASDPEKVGQIGCERLLNDTTPTYLLWLRDDRSTQLGLVGIVCKPNIKGSPPPRLEEIEKVLQPVLQCIGRELATLRRVPSSDQNQVNARLEQAEWLIDKALPRVGSATHTEPLRELLKALVDHSDAALGAIIIPDNSFRLVVEPEGWSSGPAREALKRAHRLILSRTQLEKSTFVSNKVREQSAEASAYRLLATPILQRPDHPIGYVTLLRSAIAPDFGSLEQKLLERVAPMIPTLLDRDYDSMTNLRSASGLERAFRQLLATGAIGTVASVIFIDIADFSAANRELGPAVADRDIRRVGKLLHPPLLPAGAFAARLEGGHFACLLPRTTTDEAEHIATQIGRAALKSPVERQGKEGGVKVRTGVAEATATVAGLRYALISARAESRKVESQSRTGPAVEAVAAPAVAVPPVVTPAVATMPVTGKSPAAAAYEPTRLIVPVRVREAIRDGRLKLFAQPMRPVRDMELPVRIEMLPRVQDSRGNLIAPVQFLSPAMDPDELAELDRWVMSSAIEALIAHRRNPAVQCAEFSLNLSGRSLQTTEFHDWAVEQLRRQIVPPEHWLFEISERTAAQHRRDVAKFAKKVLRLGARISIDNVGGLDGEIGRLQPHGASSIKLDGSLVRDVVSDPRAQRLVEALARWAGSSRMDTVGGQVESEQVRDQLVRLGIDYIQGFIICKPEPIEKVLAELQQPAAPSAKTGS